MSNKILLEKLYDAHLTDLADVKDILKDGVSDIFICPICLRGFTREDLDNGRLTVGHVWPDYVRQKGKKGIAGEQKVLLCDYCNNTAGSHGDKQMQLLEKIREGDETGDIYGDRLVQIIDRPVFAPIQMNVTVKWDKEDNSFTVTGKIDEKGNWMRADPKDQQRFLKLSSEKKPFSIIVNPHHELKSDLPIAGWVTSAYLSAFYALGYRYILRPELDPVRRFILNSFKNTSNERLAPPDSDDFKVTEYKSDYFFEPLLELVIPLDGQIPVHLKLSYLRYQIRLPVSFVPEVLKYCIRSSGPKLNERLAELADEGGYLSIPIVCTKTEVHDCIYDYILGKSLELPSDEDDNDC